MSTESEANSRTKQLLPVVFMFQPTHYEIVRPSRLAEWENLVAKTIRPALLSSEMRATQCYSWCGETIFDDCDAI
jgi:hypothetical protein